MNREMMKNAILILLFLILVSWNNSDQYDEKKDVVLTGKVNHYDGENAKLYLSYSQPGCKAHNEVIDITEDGTFEYHFSSYLPLDAMLLEKRTSANINFIYHPGDRIHIEFDTNNEIIPLLKTVAFNGDRSKTNNEIIKFQILKEENNLGYGAINPKEFYQLGKDDFVHKMEGVKEKQVALYNYFIDKYKPSMEAKNWSSLFALETYFYFMDDYSSEKKLPAEYFDYMKTILPVTTDKMICWSVLEDRITSYMQKIIFPTYMEKHPDFDLMKMITDKTGNSDSLFLNYMLNNPKTDLLNQLSVGMLYAALFENNMPDNYQKNLRLIKSGLSASFLSKPLQENYELLSSSQINPVELSHIVSTKMKDTPIQEIFNKIVTDNKGKVIYMDCWATWCSPCIKAMPDSKLLMSKFEGKDIAFVYVCTESDEKIWKKRLSEFQMNDGQHYFLDKNRSEFFRDIMKVDGLPWFILINKKGELVEQGHHLHPGEKLTEEKIIKLVNEL